MNTSFPLITKCASLKRIFTQLYNIEDNDEKDKAILSLVIKKHRAWEIDVIRAVLLDHTKWLDSNFKIGEQADLRETDMSNINFQDVSLKLACLQNTIFKSSKLSRMLFSGAALQNAIFDDVDLSEAICANTDLTYARFNAVFMREIYLEKASLKNAKFEECDLRRANLENASLKNANFKNCDLSGANLKSVNLADTSFDSGNFLEVNIDGAFFNNTILKSSNLNQLNFSKIELKTVSFEKSNLQECIFEGCALINLNFTNTNLQSANFDNSSIHNCTFAAATLTMGLFENSNIKDNVMNKVMANGANFFNAHFNNTKMQSAHFKKTELRNAKIENCQCNHVDFDSSNLEYAMFNNVEMKNVNFYQTNLKNAAFENSNLEGSDFRRANIYEANFKNVNLDKIKIDFKSVQKMPSQLKNKYQGKWLIFYDDDESILKSIEFAPENQQAAVSILNYFSHVLHEKFPESNASVQIIQEGNKVTMIVDPVDKGKREVIEKTLDSYGLVLAGRMEPEDFFQNSKEVLLWKQKYELAKLESNFTKELLHSERNQFSGRIDSLENQMKNMFTITSKVVSKDVSASNIEIALNNTINHTLSLKVDNNLEQVAVQKIPELIDEIQKRLPAEKKLDDDQISQINNNISAIKDELLKNQNNFLGVRENLESILDIIIGATGSITASALWPYISSFFS